LIFRKKKAIVQLILVILDLLALNLVFAVAAFILNEHWSNNQYLKVCLNYNMVWAISVYIFKYYDTPLVFEDILRKTTRFIISNLLIVLLIYFTAFEDFVTSHYFFLLFMLLLTGSLLMNRFLAKMIENKLCLFNWANKKIVLIGHLTHLDKMINILGGSSQHVQIAGIFTSDADTPAPNVLGQFHQCVEYALNNGIDHIFSSIMPYDDSRIHDVVLDADRNGIRVKFIPDFNLLFRRKVSLDLLDNHIPVVGLRTEPLETVFSRVKKRVFDVAFSLFVFVFILSWLIPIISILILITSGYPIFFVQRRSGRNAKSFNCFKFRTMVVNSSANLVHAQKNDSRLTPIGKILRKTNLDELPQFFNVLRGEMSIVGPRPHMEKQTEEYRKLIDEYMVRHFAKPGITGLAQVSGYRGEVDHEKMIKRVEMDILYTEEWNLWLDVKIILKTIKLTIKGDPNAY